MKSNAKGTEKPNQHDDLTPGDVATDAATDALENALAAWGIPNINRHILDTLSDAVKSISFGEVVLRIQDGKIVQLEKTEKLRFR